MQSLQVLVDTYNPTQRAYLFCPKRFMCWDGGVWTGKTAGLVERAHLLSCMFPGNRGAFFRYTEEDLMKTVKVTFKKLVNPLFYDPKLGGKDTDNYTRYINGSELLWMHLKDTNIKSLMSLELGWFAISQAEECEASSYEMLESRLRHRPPGWPDGVHFPQYGFIECNPNGKDWIYYRFHPDQCRDRENYAYFFTKTDENGERMRADNPDYYKTLLSKPESWKRRYFYGSREISEGQWHKEFNTRVHCYYPPQCQHQVEWNPQRVAAVDYDPFKQRKIRSIYGFYDYGLAAETAYTVVAIDSEGFSWFFGELYGIKTTIREHAAKILAFESKLPGRVWARYADPTIFFQLRRDQDAAMKSGALSTAEEYQQAGVTFLEANNDQTTGFENIEEGLKVDPERMNPLTGKKGSPKWFFSMLCPNVVEQVESQRKKLQRNPLSGEFEYIDKRSDKVPDHAYDTVLYRGNMKLDYIPFDGSMPRAMNKYVH